MASEPPSEYVVPPTPPPTAEPEAPVEMEPLPTLPIVETPPGLSTLNSGLKNFGMGGAGLDGGEKII